jgi:hypothetical protein
MLIWTLSATLGRQPSLVGARVMVSGGLVLLVMGNVAADELAAERHRGAQHDETAGDRIDDQVGCVTAPIKRPSPRKRRNRVMDSRYDCPGL